MELQEIALENSVVRPRATVLPMATDSLKIPYVNDTTHASSVYGGVIAYWTAEAALKTATKPTFGQLELTPHKLAGLTYTSNELLADSAIALEPLIRRQFGSAWGYFEDDAFLMGSGAGQPLGVFNCGCLKSVLRNTANRVHYEDLAEMYQSMLPPSIPYAVWVIHPTVIAELIELGSGNAADASGKVLIWQPDAKVGPTWTIFGRPVIISEKLQALGTAGDILFADFRYYLIGDRQSITIDASTHVAFTTDETAWRFVIRVAGQCWPQTTITSRRGAHTMTPFVQLSAATS
jgi:HK97 family phage major capsid protein